MSAEPVRSAGAGRLAGWRDTWARLGPLDATLYAIGRALARISRGRVRLLKYHLVAQPVPGDGRGTLRADANSVVAPAERDSPLTVHFPRPPEVIRQRYASGALCFAATQHGRFAGFLWLRRDSYDEDEVRCRYVLDEPEHSAWDFDVYVEPAYRHGRTMARLWQAADRHLTSQGVRWSFSRISAFNPSSLAAHTRLGLVKCHVATFFCIGPLQLSLLPQFPFVHASLHDGRCPTIRLRAPGAVAHPSAYQPLPRP